MRGPVHDRGAVPREEGGAPCGKVQRVEGLEVARDAPKRSTGFLGILVHDRVGGDLLEHRVSREEDSRLRDPEREAAGRMAGRGPHDDGPAVAGKRLASGKLVPGLERLREVVDSRDRGDDGEPRHEAEARARHVAEQELAAAVLPEVSPVEPPPEEHRA